MNRLNVTRTDKNDTRISNTLSKKRKHKIFPNNSKKKQKLATGEVTARYNTSDEPPLKDYRNNRPSYSIMRRSGSKQSQDDPFSNMDHWRNESIYTNPANVHNWSANAHSEFKLTQTYTNSGYHTQQYDQDQNLGYQAENNANVPTNWRSESSNAFENMGHFNQRNEMESKSKNSSRMVINPFALNLKETQVVDESSSDDEQPLLHISRNSKLRRNQNAKLIREGIEKYNQTKNHTWVSESHKKTETIVSNSQNDFQKAFPHFTSSGSSWQDENVEYDKLFLMLNREFLLETLRTYLYFLQDDEAKVLNFTELSDEIEINFVYFLNGNEKQNVKSRLCGESQDLYQEILDLLEAKKDVYHILSGWSTDGKQSKTVIYTKVPTNTRHQHNKASGVFTVPTHASRTTRRTQPTRKNLTGIDFVGGNANKDMRIPEKKDNALGPEDLSSCNTFKSNDPNNALNENRRGLGKPMNNLLDGLNTPVECSRAERMMHLMGWSGGALGAKQNGITEPIQPNLAMVKGRGLGHSEEQPNKNLCTKTPNQRSGSNTPHRSSSRSGKSNSLPNSKKLDSTNNSFDLDDERKMRKELKKMRRLENKANHTQLRIKRKEERVLKKLAELAKEKEERNGIEDAEICERKQDKELKKMRTKEYRMEFRDREKSFKTKAMELVLEFLKDETLEEMVCDSSLHDGERKCIHMLVESLTLGKHNSQKDDPKQQTLRDEINKYKEAKQLFAESQTVGGKRQLHLYKSLYLRTRTIKPDDVLLIKSGRYNESNMLQVRIKILKMFAELLDDDKIDNIKFSSEFNKGEPAIIRSVLNDLARGLRLTKSYKRRQNIPCTNEEVKLLNRIYDHPNVQWNLSNLPVDIVYKGRGSISKIKCGNNDHVLKDNNKSSVSLENISSDDSNEVIHNIRQKMLNRNTKSRQIVPTETELFATDTLRSGNETEATKKHSDKLLNKTTNIAPFEADLFVIDKCYSDDESSASKKDSDSDNDCVCTTKDPELIDIAGDSDGHSEKDFSKNRTTYSNNSSDVEICEEIVTPILISSSDSDSNHDVPEKSKYRSIEEYLDMSDSELKFSFKADANLNLSESDSDESKDNVSQLKLNDCVILSDTESNAMECILESQVEVNIIESDFNSENEPKEEVNALDSDGEITHNKDVNTLNSDSEIPKSKEVNTLNIDTKIAQYKEVKALDSDSAIAESKESTNGKTDIEHSKVPCSETEIGVLQKEKDIDFLLDRSDSESEDYLTIDETMNSDLDKTIDVTGDSDLKSEEIDVLNLSNNEPGKCSDLISNTVLNSDDINLIQSVLDSEFVRHDDVEPILKSDFNDDSLISDLKSELEAEEKSAIDTILKVKSVSKCHDPTEGVTDLQIKSQKKCIESIDAISVFTEKPVNLTDLKSNDEECIDTSVNTNIVSSEVDKSVDLIKETISS